MAMFLNDLISVATSSVIQRGIRTFKNSSEQQIYRGRVQLHNDTKNKSVFNFF